MLPRFGNQTQSYANVVRRLASISANAATKRQRLVASIVNPTASLSVRAGFCGGCQRVTVGYGDKIGTAKSAMDAAQLGL
jgi:hypothetical protein